MIELPTAFIERMNRRLGGEAEEFFSTYALPPQKAIRVNDLKISAEDFSRISPFVLQPVPWEKNGFYITDEKPGKHPFHAAGLYYVQEPSAMCAAPMLGVGRGERVLDLCSAPGGKGTQLAQAMRGEGILWLNEINFERAKILSQNVERLGIRNAVVTCASPHDLAKELNGYFDKILVDAPCSGEGMFKKEPNAIPEWSVENVNICAERQKDILDCADAMLKEGGSLLYSTCTFSREEDEGQTENFLARHKNYALEKQVKLYPHKARGEGHYAALLKKNGGGEQSFIKPLSPAFRDAKLLSVYRAFESEFLKIKFGRLHLVGDHLYSLPQDLPRASVQTLRAGIRLGEFRSGRFYPSHSLAMCLNTDEAYHIGLDEESVSLYLSGNVFPCAENVKGWLLATYFGYPLGWCKAVNGTAKNHLPKGLRIDP